MQTSIVITTYNRNAQLSRTLDSIFDQDPGRESLDDIEVVIVDDGTDEPWEDNVSDADRYIRLSRPPSAIHRNPALPLNIGIRAAKGEIILLQNAECRHIDPNAINKITNFVTANNAVFARVVALDEAGRESILYCGAENPRPYFFCGAIRREWFDKLRGFDEEYTTYGFDDDDMADRLRREGVEFVFTDILAHHQWHPQAGSVAGWEAGRAIYDRKRSESTVRNLDHEWGTL